MGDAAAAWHVLMPPRVARTSYSSSEGGARKAPELVSLHARGRRLCMHSNAHQPCRCHECNSHAYMATGTTPM